MNWSTPSWSPRGEYFAFIVPKPDEPDARIHVASLADDWHSQSLALDPSEDVTLSWLDRDTLLVRQHRVNGEGRDQLLRISVQGVLASELALDAEYITKLWSNERGSAFVLGPHLAFLHAASAPAQLEDEALRFFPWRVRGGSNYADSGFCQNLYLSPDGQLAAGCAGGTANPQPVELEGGVKLGHIRLPGTPEELSQVSRDPHGDVVDYSSPSSLKWAPTGSRVAYVMEHYPAKPFAACDARRLFVADVLSAELLNQADLSCGDSLTSRYQFAFADEHSVLFVLRGEDADPSVSLLRLGTSGKPELIGTFPGENYPLLIERGDAQGVYLVTQPAGAERRFLVRHGSFADLSAGRPLSTITSGRGRFGLPLVTSAQGATLVIDVTESDNCSGGCTFAFAINAEAGDRSLAKLDEKALLHSFAFVPPAGVVGLSKKGGLVFLAADRLDVPFVIHATAETAGAPPAYPD